LGKREAKDRKGRISGFSSAVFWRFFEFLEKIFDACLNFRGFLETDAMSTCLDN
jgi:hypothetical protein